MTREELLKSPAYWEQGIQIELYRCAADFMQKNHMNRTQLAQHLGVSKGYVTQLLSGDYNYSLAKLVEVALKLGVAPQVAFKPIDKVIQEDTQMIWGRPVFVDCSTYVQTIKSLNNDAA